MSIPHRLLRIRWAVPAVVVTALASSLSIAGLDDSDAPTRFRATPGLKGQPVEMPRGKTLLFLFLQRLADYDGRDLYFVGESTPDEKILIAADLPALSAAEAGKTLRKAGFDLSAELYRENKVLWVQRRLVPPKKRGRLIRRGEAGDENGKPGSNSARSVEREQKATSHELAAGVSSFERRAGDGSRFLVTFETSSREEAEDVTLLVESYLKRRRDRAKE